MGRVGAILNPFGEIPKAMNQQKEQNEAMKKAADALDAAKAKVPDRVSALETAKRKQVAQRRSILAMGGNIDTTGGTAALSTGQVKKQTLG